MDRLLIVACGTSWHAGLVGKFLVEQLARVPVEVDYGSEYRYRDPIVDERTLTVVITQSGETADTLAALREAKRKGAASLAVCNVVGSMVTRESDGVIYTHAGPEIGVASTKAFTDAAGGALPARAAPGAGQGHARSAERQPHLDALAHLPHCVEQVLKADAQIEEVAARFHTRSDFLFLGRGIHYPIALEGALKLKEISYIHAEGYPAGEMKHGPIALIDDQMPVVALMPHDAVYEKMLGNVQEAKARGGTVIAVATEGAPGLDRMLHPERDALIRLPAAPALTSPIVATVPLQLLAYHIAVRRGCDVDQPRNLAKSVTVE